MAQKKHIQTYNFEDDYFKGYFIKEISDFTEGGFNRMYNWFKGMFVSLNKYTNILDGNGKTAIEFGCALGAASKVLSDFGYTVTATDVSGYAIKRAQKLCPEVTFLKHDIQKPLHINKKYDLVFALDVIEHLEQADKAIQNMFHLVHKDGLVLCSTPNDYEYARRIPSHINVKKPEEWKRIFKAAGFQKIIIRQLTFIPFFYRLHWRLNFAIPYGINFEPVPSPVFIIAHK